MDQIMQLFVWGVNDSLNPCRLAILAWFMAMLLSLSHDRVSLRRFAIAFLIPFYLIPLVFLIGAFSSFFLSDLYYMIAQGVFLVLGAWLILIAVKHWLSWFRMAFGKAEKVAVNDEVRLPHRWLIPIAIGVGFIAGLVVPLWPVNAYVTVIASNLLMPGLARGTFGALAMHGFFQVFLLILMVLGFLLSPKDGPAPAKKLFSDSTILAVLSAFYGAIGAGVIYIVLVKF